MKMASIRKSYLVLLSLCLSVLTLLLNSNFKVVPTPLPTLQPTFSPTQLPDPFTTKQPTSPPTKQSTSPPTSPPTSTPILKSLSTPDTSPERRKLEFYTKIHNSLEPVKEAGKWVYKPGIEAIHPSADHLTCLDEELQGNCHDEDAWKKTDEKAKKIRHENLMRGAVSNSPGILAANDPWVWQSDLPQYQVLSHEDPDLYKKKVQEVLQKTRTIYLIGDSLTRQWSQTMICELIHVHGVSAEEAKIKVQYLQVHTSLEKNIRRNTFRNTTEQDYVVFNIGHHVGWKLGTNWTEPYRELLDDALTYSFGRIPPQNIFFRTTSVRHFHKDAGDWDTESSKSGGTEPKMHAKWSFYGGTRPEQPMQNLIAFDVFLGPHTYDSNRKFQILDISPMMLARGDATFDGCHFCLPGPMEYWSRMLYHRLLQDSTSTI